MEQLLNGSMMGQQPYESNRPSKMQQYTGTRRMSRAIGIIPARLQSSRIPQKALVDICGLPMVIHVLNRAKQSPALSEVYVATDSQKIVSVVESHGGKAILTSVDHKNGTERAAEAIKSIEGDIFVLIMGDEALLDPDHIKTSIDALKESEDASASLLVTEFRKDNSPGDFKVVVNSKSEAMYISRGDIPCSARNSVDYRLKAYHVMSFSRIALEKYASMEKSTMEKIEDHEHLRLLENGYKIVCKKVDSPSISVDYPEDLEFVRKEILKREHRIVHR
jgi:3-deoxy-manno-octulosonate cytidylyltransferase (CMP-KDO synthetase)